MSTTIDKAQRQSIIRRIIERQKVSSQEELKTLLAGAGYQVAQATLSRDIKEMKIVKTAGGYRIPSKASVTPRHTMRKAY